MNLLAIPLSQWQELQMGAVFHLSTAMIAALRRRQMGTNIGQSDWYSSA